VSWKKNNLHDHVRRREGAATETKA